MTAADTVKVAIVQEPPVILDLKGALSKASDCVARATGEGAVLVVFPETWLTCYPAWVFGLAGWDDEEAKRWYARLLDESPVLGSDEQLDDDLAVLREAAREHGVTVVMGMNERARKRSGTLYNSLVTIGPDGRLLNVHRKLTPTHTERIVWASGDASGLRVVETDAGRVGGLVCWEHWNPLERYALHSQDEEIHVASWPDITEMHLLASRNYAFEGRSHVLCAGQLLRTSDVPSDLLEAYRKGVGPDAPADGTLFAGGSCVIAPDGRYLVEPRFDYEGIIFAELDLSMRSREQQSLDTVGHYSRPDIFTLTVDRRRHDSVTLLDD